jgi:mannose-6-phosphate isomerase-like protein (cupin superfamily)
MSGSVMRGARAAIYGIVLGGSVLMAQSPADAPTSQFAFAAGDDLMTRAKVDIAKAPDFSATAVKNNAEYRVNMVHRGKADNALAHKGYHEMHYIIDGSGIVVLGGKLVKTADGKTVIEGGEEHHVKKGDVIIVPDGTPHWYKQVDGSITYLEGRFIAPGGVEAGLNKPK